MCVRAPGLQVTHNRHCEKHNALPEHASSPRALQPHHSNRCAPRQHAISMCCMHRLYMCRSTRCGLETGLGLRYGGRAHYLHVHLMLPAKVLRTMDRVAVEQQGCPNHTMHMCTAWGMSIYASCYGQRAHNAKHEAHEHLHRGV